MKFDRDVIEGVLSQYFTPDMVENLTREMKALQTEVNALKKVIGKPFVMVRAEGACESEDC